MDKKWIYYELLKINDQKIPEMNTSEEIFKLNAQMKSKSCNLYVNRKLRTRGIQQDQNYQILICQLKVIDPESQRLTSDERWTVLGQTLNSRGKWTQNLMKLLSTESWWKEESNETKIKWFGIIIREISYFQNQRLFGLKFGENEEHYELICKIKLLNLIKTQITSW